MQKPFWEIKGRDDLYHYVRAYIRKGHVKITRDEDTIVEKYISGSKNVISFFISDGLYSLYLLNKPVGGYHYALYDFEKKKINASDPNLTVASPDYIPTNLPVLDDINKSKAPPIKKMILRLLVYIGMALGLLVMATLCHFFIGFGWVDFFW